MGNVIQDWKSERPIQSIPLHISGIDAQGKAFEELSYSLGIDNSRAIFHIAQQLTSDALLHLEVYPPQEVAGIGCKFVTYGRITNKFEVEGNPAVVIQFSEPLRFFSIY